MKDLIEKLEAASEGSRELDAEIALAVTRQQYPDAYFVDDDRTFIQVMPGMTASDIPRFTRSIDAALTLVPEDFDVAIGGTPPAGGFDVTVGSDIMEVDETASAQTPALALCIAALKAREAQE